MLRTASLMAMLAAARVIPPLRPASSHISSEMLDASPGPASTSTRWPALANLCTGVRSQHHPTLARRPVFGHSNPHEAVSRRARVTAATAASKNTGSSS
jgi:hypothetical protein